MKAHKWPKELLIIRHGQSERNVKKDIAKDAGKKVDFSNGVRDQDTPLTAVGITQAEKTGKYLREQFPFRSIELDAFIISPYLRAQQTFERIAYQLGYPIPRIYEERIREIDFGILDGLTPEGVKAKYPEEVARRAREGKYYYRPPGGECRPDVRLRCLSMLATLSRDYVDKRVVIICHSVVVLVFRSLLERWTESSYLAVDKEQDVLNCGMTRYERDEESGKLHLESYNLVAY